MPAPIVEPETSPQFHPEFGYFWPVPQARRILYVAIICTVCGAAAGAAAVFAGVSGIDTDPAPTANLAPSIPSEPGVEPKLGPSTVGRAFSAEPASAETPSADAMPSSGDTRPCSQQTWPYLDANCLAASKAAGTATKDVRVLRPEQPAQSASPMVIAAPSGKEAAKAEADATAAKAAATAKETPKRENRRRHAKRARQPADPEGYEAYAAPYRERYEPRRRDWDWGW